MNMVSPSENLLTSDSATMVKALDNGSSRKAGKSEDAAPLKDGLLNTEGLPVDRGYAWVIAFACMFCSVVCLGLQRANGILFVEFLTMFRKSASETSLILSLQTGVMSVASLLTQTVLMLFLSERQIVVMGGLIGGVGVALSFFATSLYMLYFTISFLGGIGLAMIMGPTLVIINFYFEKRRSLATSISMLGGNIGSTIFPIYTQTLITELGARGALLVLGATYLNVMVGGMLLRPFHLNRRRIGKDEEAKALTDAEEDGEVSDMAPTRAHHASHAAYSRQLSLDATSQNSQNSAAVARALSVPELTLMPPEVTVEFKRAMSDVEDEGRELAEGRADGRTARETGSESSCLQVTQGATSGGSSRQVSAAGQANGSSEGRERKNVCAKILAVFDLSLFRLPLFWHVIVCSCFSTVPMLMSTYIPSLAEERGVGPQDAAVLLTIIGACGMSSRLIIGYFADLNLIRRSTLLALTLVVTCCPAYFLPLLTSFTSLAVFSAIFGFFGTTQMSLMPVVMVDLLGLSKMSKTLGYRAVIAGALLSGCLVLVGYLRDLTGSYDVSFYFMASCGLAGSFFLFATPLFERLEARMLHKQGTAPEAESGEDGEMT